MVAGETEHGDGAGSVSAPAMEPLRRGVGGTLPSGWARRPPDGVAAAARGAVARVCYAARQSSADAAGRPVTTGGPENRRAYARPPVCSVHALARGAGGDVSREAHDGVRGARP